MQPLFLIVTSSNHSSSKIKDTLHAFFSGGAGGAIIYNMDLHIGIPISCGVDSLMMNELIFTIYTVQASIYFH
jgi:hypothetical protein